MQTADSSRQAGSITGINRAYKALCKYFWLSHRTLKRIHDRMRRPRQKEKKKM